MFKSQTNQTPFKSTKAINKTQKTQKTQKKQKKQKKTKKNYRHLCDLNACGQSPVDFESTSLTPRTRCH